MFDFSWLATKCKSLHLALSILVHVIEIEVHNPNQALDTQDEDIQIMRSHTRQDLRNGICRIALFQNMREMQGFGIELPQLLR